ncbi:MAG: hypothetical protein AAF790_03125 [Planctomycetota bacterium]
MLLRSPLRRDLALVNANAAVWAVGNGLVSTTLVIYLALALGAPGKAIGLILAAPRLAGVLRLGAPLLLTHARRRKPLCLGLLTGSAAVLGVLPHAAAPRWWAGGESAAGLASGAGLAVLVGCWCVYHLLEYLGVVLLWSWLGDLMRGPVRGRLIGQRESCLVIGRVVGMTASFALVAVWRWLAPDAPRWAPLGWSAGIGAAVLLASVLPLWWVSPREAATDAPQRQNHTPLRAMLACLVDPRYRRLLVFSVCFSLANGISITAQSLYPQRVLGVTYPVILGLRCAMRGGQALLAPAAGWWMDKRGAPALLIVSQLLVATCPLFFFAATPDRWWWLAGAFAAWTAYAGVNVGLDCLKLSLAPPGPAAPALAVYYGTSDLAIGVMAVAGGFVFDYLTEGGADAAWLYGVLFLVGWAARTAVATLLVGIDKPPGEPPVTTRSDSAAAGWLSSSERRS